MGFHSNDKRKDEDFVGNCNKERFDYLKINIKKIRRGKQGFSINGEKLVGQESIFLPIYVNKDSMDSYNKLIQDEIDSIRS